MLLVQQKQRLVNRAKPFLHWRMVNCIELAKTTDYDDVWQ
jgi:hypothetical protein